MSLEAIYLLHRSHTDIGFRLDQPVLWEMERRFIDTAIDAAERQQRVNAMLRGWL